MSTKTVLSKLRGTTQALYILTVHQNSRFEFIFTNMSLDNTRQFPAVFDVYKYGESATRSSSHVNRNNTVQPLNTKQAVPSVRFVP